MVVKRLLSWCVLCFQEKDSITKCIADLKALAKTTRAATAWRLHHLRCPLQNKLFALKGCLCVQHLHVSGYKINILLFILKRLLSVFAFGVLQSWSSRTVLRGGTCFTATLAQTLNCIRSFLRGVGPSIRRLRFYCWTFGLIIGVLACTWDSTLGDKRPSLLLRHSHQVVALWSPSHWAGSHANCSEGSVGKRRRWHCRRASHKGEFLLNSFQINDQGVSKHSRKRICGR